MVRYKWLLCCTFFWCASILHAQQQAPTDAREFLAQHAFFVNSSKTVRADEQATLRHAFFYLQAGAEGELRHEIAKLTEGQPDALRFAMVADCWNPETYSRGLERSGEWLAAFPERPAAEQQSVQGIRDFLTAELQRRTALNDRRSATAWLPLLSLAAVMALAAGGLRWWP